jgi:hypothetical protein
MEINARTRITGEFVNAPPHVQHTSKMAVPLKQKHHGDYYSLCMADEAQKSHKYFNFKAFIIHAMMRLQWIEISFWGNKLQQPKKAESINLFSRWGTQKRVAALAHLSLQIQIPFIGFRNWQ